MMRKFLVVCLFPMALAACGQGESVPVTAPQPESVLAPGAAAQCSKDTDCKGDRICDGGKCTAPVVVESVVEASMPSGPCAPHKLVFTCDTTKGKHVQVCDAGPTINYAFGKAGQVPEISLAVPRGKASTYQWQGMGTLSYAVNVPNGDTVYSVFFSAERDPEGDPTAGINVTVKGQHVATVECVFDTLQQELEGIDLKADET